MGMSRVRDNPGAPYRIGWQGLADLLGLSLRATRARKDDLMAYGVCCEMRLGWPPQRRLVYFPDRIPDWIRDRARHGKRL